MYQYSDTLEFDLVVILFVVAVMPLSVFLMQSKNKTARVASFALLFLAVFYVVRREGVTVFSHSCLESWKTSCTLSRVDSLVQGVTQRLLVCVLRVLVPRRRDVVPAAL
jgi:hypothetical protein